MDTAERAARGSTLARLIDCPDCGQSLEEPRLGWRGGGASCPWCGVPLRKDVPWLAKSLGGLTALLTIGILTGVDPFDASTSWLQRGLGLAALLAAIALLWWAE